MPHDPERTVTWLHESLTRHAQLRLIMTAHVAGHPDHTEALQTVLDCGPCRDFLCELFATVLTHAVQDGLLAAVSDATDAADAL